MGHNPEKHIYKVRSELREQLLDCSATPRHPFGEHMMIALLLLPIIALGSIFSEPLPSSTETLHGAPPPGVQEDIKDADDREVVDFICEEMCTQVPVIFPEFCTESCPYFEWDMSIHDVIKQQEQASLDKLMLEKAYALEPELKKLEANIRNFADKSAKEEAEKRPRNQIGVYLTPSSTGRDKKLSETFSNLEEGIGNAFVFDVKGSYVYFDSSAPLAHELGLVRPAYDLPEIIQKAKEKGLYTIGRFIVAKDPSLARRRTETQITNIYTGYGIGDVWVNPGHETVIKYNEQVLRDLIASGVDEVNFDYIRFPTEYNQAAINLSGEEKANLLMKFLTMARDVVEELDSDTRLGISTYAILGWNFPVNFEPLGQDIARFASIVDVISPMAYPSTFSEGSYYNPAKHPGSRMYYLVYRTLEGYKKLLGEDSHKLRPWIQGYYINTQNITDQANAVFDTGLCGFTVWNANSNYEHTYKALQSLEVPEECK